MPRDDPTARPTHIDFAPFRLDLVAGQLLRETKPIALRPKTWAVLRYLAERPGRLITKDELLDTVWADVAVTESVLSKSIGELRVALDDSFKTPRRIETVQRRGFRFIAPLLALHTANATSRPSVETLESSRLAPFVGRTEELRQLTARLDQAQRGERQMVVVTGPAGIGKTALVDEFLGSPAVREATSPIWIARGGCVEQHGSHEAYLPVLEALERLLRRPDSARLRRSLERCAPTWLAQMPWLLNEAEHRELQESLHSARPERMLRELAVLIETWTADATLVLVVEDLHWSDPSTIDLLSMLAERHEPARLLVIGTYRPADAVVHAHAVMKATRRLLARRRCVELPLHDLSEAAVSSYLQARFDGAPLPRALARQIHSHTDGNPLFMTAVVDHLLARGDLVRTATRWELNTPAETIDLGMPSDVRMLIESQLDDLSAADRSLLEAASVAGDTFTALVVAAALGHEVAETEMRCEEFARAQRFLRVAGHVEWPDGSVSRRYTFLHQLYRRGVYTEIPEGQCMCLHQRIGQALESVYGVRQLEIAPQLATHFGRGRDHVRALRYLTAAAAGARQRFASREVIGYIDAALVLVALLPDDDERARRELELRLILSAAISDIHGFASERAHENYERAFELCKLIGDPSQLFRILYARWYFHAFRSDRDATIKVVAELEKLAQRLRVPEYRRLADSAHVRTATFDGRFAEAVAIAERRLALKDRGAIDVSSSVQGPDPLLVANTHAAISKWFLGDADEARAHCRQTVALARRCNHSLTLNAVLMQTSLVEVLSRDTASAAGLTEQCIALAADNGFAFWHAAASIVKGRVLIEQDQPIDGIAQIERAIAALKATGTSYFSAFAHAFVATGHLRTGDSAAGLAAVEEGLRIAQTTLDRAYEPELWRLKGELLLATTAIQPSKSGQRRGAKLTSAATRRSEAERCLLHALELARAASAKSLEIRVATSLARAWSAQAQVDQARTVLDGICKWFPARSGSADVVEARLLLRQLE